MTSAQPLPAVTIAPHHAGGFAVSIGIGWPSRFPDHRSAREHGQALASERELPLLDLCRNEIAE